jgi:hypothetical protein
MRIVRLTSFVASLAIVATVFAGVVTATGAAPAAADVQPAGSTALVQTLEELWDAERSVGTELAALDAARAELAAIVQAGPRAAPGSVFVELAVQDAARRSLAARRDALARHIDDAKTALAQRGTQETAVLGAERASLAAADPRWAAVDAAIAAIPYPVRTLGVRIVLGSHPAVVGAWGAYDHRTNHVYLAAEAFATEARLRYVVAHELAHAYEERRMDDASRRQALALLHNAGSAAPAEELLADTIATIWGAGSDAFYWAPPTAVTEAVAPLIR